MLPIYLALPLTSKVSLKSAMLVRCPLEAHPLRLCRHHETLDVLERACGDQSVLALANKEDFFGLSLRNMLLSKKKKGLRSPHSPTISRGYPELRIRSVLLSQRPHKSRDHVLEQGWGWEVQDQLFWRNPLLA